MIWTDTLTEQLRTLYATGLPASLMAAELGHGMSRNAVIGKVHRLGLERRGRTAGTRKSTKRAAKPRKSRAVGNIFATRWGASGGEVLPGEVPPTPIADLIPFNTTFADIASFQCRWIVDEVQTLFCGHPALVGSWCPTHRAIVFEPRVPRHRKVAAWPILVLA